MDLKTFSRVFLRKFPRNTFKNSTHIPPRIPLGFLPKIYPEARSKNFSGIQSDISQKFLQDFPKILPEIIKGSQHKLLSGVSPGNLPDTSS